MNNRKLTLFSVLSVMLVLTLTVENASPQIIKSRGKYKPAAVTVEFLANFNQPLPSLYGKISEFFDYKNYGVTYGFGSQINVKIAANKKGTVRPYFTLGYALFRGKDENTAYIGRNIIDKGYPPPNNEKFQSTPGRSEMFLHDFYGGAGFEYAFVNRTKWTPYLGTDINLNIIFGTYRQDPNQAIGGGTSDEVSYTIKQGARFGFSAGGGVQFRFGKVAGMVVSVKYRLANLLGKSSERETEVNKMQLLDKSATDLHSSLNKDRQIDFFEFGLGVVFFVGRR